MINFLTWPFPTNATAHTFCHPSGTASRSSQTANSSTTSKSFFPGTPQSPSLRSNLQSKPIKIPSYRFFGHRSKLAIRILTNAIRPLKTPLETPDPEVSWEAPIKSSKLWIHLPSTRNTKENLNCWIFRLS